MKISKLLPILLMPNIAMAKGGGGLVMGIIFLPILIWIIIKIWSFWFRLIFGGSSRESFRNQQSKIRKIIWLDHRVDENRVPLALYFVC